MRKPGSGFVARDAQIPRGTPQTASDFAAAWALMLLGSLSPGVALS